MKDYAEYKHEFMKDWTQKVSRAAGVAQGRGARGKMKLQELCKKLSNDQDPDAFRTRWMRWKAGLQAPSYDSFKAIHARAVNLGYLGQGQTLRAMQERGGMLSEAEWDFWRRYEADPAFEIEEREQELRERLAALEREAMAIRRALGLE